MADKGIDKEKIIAYWLRSSDEDFTTMEIMYASKRYTWTLFLGHLSIEKLLKAYYVKKNNEHAPYTHSLLRLAEKCKLNLDKELKEELITITAFNISARYDDYKMAFYKKCTKEYSSNWIEKIKVINQWIKEQLSK